MLLIFLVVVVLGIALQILYLNLPLPVAIFVHLISLTTLAVLVAASVGVRPRVKPRTTNKKIGNLHSEDFIIKLDQVVIRELNENRSLLVPPVLGRPLSASSPRR